MPFEYLGFVVPAGYRVVIAKHPDAETRAVRVVIGNGELGISTDGGTYGHNSAAGGFGVAAVDVAEAGGGEFTGGPTTPIETYSSDGPRRIFYTSDNNPIDAGAVTFASGGGESRNKPDLAAADGVSTTLPGFSGLNPFFGTSAAAPHAAAIAALVKSAVPGATSGLIRNAMLQGSTDIEAAGTDRDSGRGIVSAFASLGKAHAHPAAFIEAGNITVIGSASGFVLPGGTGTASVQLVNNGGAKATAVSAVVTTTTPGVTITTGSVSVGTLLAGASVTLPSFAFSVDPGVTCGLKIDFRLAVTFTGFGTSPTIFHFFAQVGAPSTLVETTTYAGPAVAIPDGDPAGISVPLTVSGGGIASMRFHFDGSTCSTTAGSTTVGLTHSWVGDLTATLTSPTGTSVVLMSRPGGELNGANNFCQTVLSDSATPSIQDITASGAPYTGTFKPAQPLSRFASETAAGTWVLTLSDGADFDTGTIRNFGIDITGFTCTP
jgi:subtilisin-like proprotein convertase family protein